MKSQTQSRLEVLPCLAAKTKSRQQEVDCGNLHSGEIYVPHLAATTTTTIVPFFNYTWRVLQVEEADFIFLKLLVSCKTHWPHWGTSPWRQPRSPCMFWWPQGLSLPSAKEQQFHSELQMIQHHLSGCSVLTNQTVVDSVVNLAEETLTQDLAHGDVTSGNFVFL